MGNIPVKFGPVVQEEMSFLAKVYRGTHTRMDDGRKTDHNKKHVRVGCLFYDLSHE